MINYRAWDKEHHYMENTHKNLIVTFADDDIIVVDNNSLSKHSQCNKKRFKLSSLLIKVLKLINFII